MAAEPDPWSQWLLGRRDASDTRQCQVTLEHLLPIRDRILDQAMPLAGATLLDVGSGDGLIGLEALERVGPNGRVIFADISSALLEQSRRAVVARDLLDRAEFVSTRAESLAGIADRSVDVATTRSVLIYVEDKANAFASLLRVLRPGGRISLFEPINRLMFPEPRDRFWGYDVGGVSELADKVKAGCDEVEGPVAAAMMDFDDRDLARLAEAAGFDRIHLECHVDIEPDAATPSVSLDTFLDSAPNPLAPTVRESVAAALTSSEQARFVGHLERAMAEGRFVRRSAVAYLTAHAEDAGLTHSSA